MTARCTLLAVEDDPALLFIAVALDADIGSARIAAFEDFFAHDLPHLAGWLRKLRNSLPSLYLAPAFSSYQAGRK